MRKEKNVLWKLTEHYILQIEFEKARLFILTRKMSAANKGHRFNSHEYITK